jgi:hypothetical protein
MSLGKVLKDYFNKDFSTFYKRLPSSVQKQATIAFEHFSSEERYPSLHFKCVNKRTRKYSIRIGKGYRAIGSPYAEGVKWEWIGNHDEYERRID